MYIEESKNVVNLSKPNPWPEAEVLCTAHKTLFIKKTEYNACIEPASVVMIFR